VTMNQEWQERYREALVEINLEELPRRIEAARKAIYHRIEELRGADAVSPLEQQAIEDALRSLQVLAKTECRIQGKPGPGLVHEATS
jgi:hypothetical protein